MNDQAVDSPYLDFPREDPPSTVRPKTLPPIPRALHVNETPELVVDCVLESYGVTHEKLKYGGKLKALAEARNVAYWLLRDVSKLSWTEIGEVMSRDHTTAMAGVKTVLRQRASNERFLAFTDELAAAVKARLEGGTT